MRGTEPDSLMISALSADLCLNYANTLSWRGTETPSEALLGLPDLLAWLERSSGMSFQVGPPSLEGLLTEAIALREALFRIFSALASGEPAPEQDFQSLQKALAAAPSRDHIVRHAEGYAWHVGEVRPSAPALLAPVLGPPVI